MLSYVRARHLLITFYRTDLSSHCLEMVSGFANVLIRAVKTEQYTDHVCANGRLNGPCELQR